MDVAFFYTLNPTPRMKNIFGIFADEQVFTSSMCGTMP